MTIFIYVLVYIVSVFVARFILLKSDEKIGLSLIPVINTLFAVFMIVAISVIVPCLVVKDIMKDSKFWLWFSGQK